MITESLRIGNYEWLWIAIFNELNSEYLAPKIAQPFQRCIVKLKGVPYSDSTKIWFQADWDMFFS